MTNQERIGKVLDAEATRDAVHIAILPVFADENIYPGALVQLVYGTTDRVRQTIVGYSKDDPSIGVADPFLKDYIKKDERFFVFLHPNTIVGMRHVWEHPAIDNVQFSTNASEIWLRRFAGGWNFDYDELINEALAGAGGYAVARGVDLHSASELGADHDLFWTHLENLTGKTFGVEHRKNFGWTCSC